MTRLLMSAALAIVLASCSSVQQELNPEIFYKRDIGIEINGKQYDGVVVIPHAQKYDLVFRPKGDMDLILLRTCHREFSGEKISSSLFSKREFKYTYEPIKGLEDTRVCPMRVDAYESGKGRNSWALLDFQNPQYSLDGELTCNGTVSKLIGVSACQAKRDTVQRIKFYEPVQFTPPSPSDCAIPKKKGDFYEFNISPGECLYHVRTQDNKIARLTTVGYNGVLVREPQ